MAIPQQRAFQRPVLEILNEAGAPRSIRDLIGMTAELLELSEHDRQEKERNGAPKYEKGVRWAAYYLKIAGLAENPRRGQYEISSEGRKFLGMHQGDITLTQLKMMGTASPGQQPVSGSTVESLETMPLQGENIGTSNLEDADATPILEDADTTPDDLMQAGYRQLQAKLADDLLETMKSVSPNKFERLVLDLLNKMGYGEPEHTGRVGDDGIDGIMREDPLGLGKIYMQAKRWASTTVPSGEIEQFDRALDNQGATKGVFCTTSIFGNPAKRRALDAQGKTIRLIDGKELARLMIEYGVGVVTEYAYEVKNLDENYFAEDV